MYPTSIAIICLRLQKQVLERKEQAGFIEAPPDINAKKNISSPTMPPIAIPLNPFSPLV